MMEGANPATATTIIAKPSDRARNNGRVMALRRLQITSSD